MKIKAKSPANIAFIKFWGKKDNRLNIPFNDSMSMNLSDCFTVAMVDFDPQLKEDKVFINRTEVFGGKKRRVTDFLDVVRKKAGIKIRALVESENNFPGDSGIASSASAFSALALAASKSAGLDLSQKELSMLARRGSGSACRSIGDGFTYWKKGGSEETSYAVPLAPADYWNIRDIVTVVSDESKKISSTEGHDAALSSPYFRTRLKILPIRTKEMKKAILGRDFKKFGELLEEEAVDLHLIAMTSKPPIFYWSEGTILVMRKVREWREEGLGCYFTMDAGANVHVFCRAGDADKVNKKLKSLPPVKFTIINKPGPGARVI